MDKQPGKSHAAVRLGEKNKCFKQGQFLWFQIRWDLDNMANSVHCRSHIVPYSYIYIWQFIHCIDACAYCIFFALLSYLYTFMSCQWNRNASMGSAVSERTGLVCMHTIAECLSMCACVLEIDKHVAMSALLRVKLMPFAKRSLFLCRFEGPAVGRPMQPHILAWRQGATQGDHLHFKNPLPHTVCQRSTNTTHFLIRRKKRGVGTEKGMKLKEAQIEERDETMRRCARHCNSHECENVEMERRL